MRPRNGVQRPVEDVVSGRTDIGQFLSNLEPEELEILHKRLQGATRIETVDFTGMTTSELETGWRKLANKAELFYGPRNRP